MTFDPATPPAGIPALLCHCAALRTAARRATALYDAAMAAHGLRISQFGILSRLRRMGPLSLHALAAELVLDRTTLGRNLAPLERDGLVISEVDPADRRVRRVAITETGRALMRQALPAWEQAQRAFEARYGAAEAQALRQDLHRLTAALPLESGAADID